jgi:hypothetical protein
MKKITRLSFVLLLISSSLLCSAQTTPKSSATAGSVLIEAYYFHNAARCVTCKAVESEAKADLENLYGKQVSFKALNLEDESTKAIAEKLQVSGQTLLVVKGDKKLNLTNEGFMYARTNPAKFKQIIKEKVDKL